MMEFTITNKNNIGTVEVHNYREENGVCFYDIDIDFGKVIQPEPVEIKWSAPRKNVFTTWGTTHHYGNGIPVDWGTIPYYSKFAQGAPVLSLIGLDDKNAETIAVADPYTPMTLTAGVREENVQFVYTLTLFSTKIGLIEKYHTTIRFDLRDDIYFYESVEGVVQWWSSLGFKSCNVPDTARMPMYSTWYSFHQNMTQDELVEQCRLAKKLGMEAIIIDDGWQTDDNNRGYAYCGDWEPTPNKFPDMKKMVDEIHDIGMKVIVWFSVPYVGIHTKVYEQFKGMFLDDKEDVLWFNFDPRYKEVRDYLISIYKEAALNWGIDGFKLDFIDSIFMREFTPLYDERMDYSSLELATERLMQDVMKTLREINPDVLIEFRQNYIGPVMRTFGNMLRVGDCPNDSLANRIGTVDLRLISDTTAVHSDMMEWHGDESVEVAALQMLNIMFAVPQVSVRIDEINDEHYRMLDFYLKYWIKNRKILLDGKLKPKGIANHYTLVSSEDENKVIAVGYSDIYFKGDSRELNFLNATGGEKLIIEFDCGGEGEYEIYDCMGTKTESGKFEKSGLKAFNVPKSGMIIIK